MQLLALPLVSALMIALLLVGCTPGQAQDERDNPRPDNDNANGEPGPDGPDGPDDEAPPVRYLALGDSYTIGEGLTDPAGRWPVQLVERLRAGGARIDDPRIIARTGWTTADLLRALRQEDGDYDFVTLMIGVNNQYRGGSKGTFRAELTELIGKCVQYAGGDARNVIVVSIPDWGATPFASGRNRPGIAADIDAFNAIIREEVAAVAGVSLVDITPLSREIATDAANLTRDGLHYSAAGCAAWANAVEPVARRTPALSR